MMTRRRRIGFIYVVKRIGKGRLSQRVAQDELETAALRPRRAPLPV